MIRPLSVALLIAVGGSIAYAQSSGEKAIAERKALMKEQSAAGREPSAMLKGEMPFDLAKVQDALKKLQETSLKAKTLFPDDSKTGDTRALPVIWEKKAQFLAAFDKLNADAKAAAAAIKDEASFKAEWGKVAANCAACHKEYRKS
ncbi:MAG TPA: cytochrome c [Hyphomicrobiaceae bacterium]|nr:cytochrome c [Hyphomicrobiaceae bacterium]